MGLPCGSAGKETACSVGDLGSIPGFGRSPGEGKGYPLQYSRASLVSQLVKNPPAMWETGFNPLVGKIPWRRAWQPTPWTEDPGGLQSMVLQRVGDYLAIEHSRIVYYLSRSKRW